MAESNDPALFTAIGRTSWYVSKSGRQLHWAQIGGDLYPSIAADWFASGNIRLACGGHAAELHIPGVFTRMGMARCKGCCLAMGYPQGTGSPKNDPACRKILGLPVTARMDGTDWAVLHERDVPGKMQ